MSRPGLLAQANGVRRAFINLRGHRRNIATAKRPRTAEEIALVDQHIRELEAAADTFDWLAANGEAFREFYRTRGQK
jgi:hypothetical protein